MPISKLLLILIPSDTEIEQMKFDIARAMLKADVLNEGLSLNTEES